MRSETESRAVRAVLLIWQTAGSDWVRYPLPTVLRSLIRHSEECLFATFPCYSVTSWVPKILLAYRLEKRAILKQIIIQNVPPSPASRTLHSKAKLQSITGGPPPLRHSAPPTSCSFSPFASLASSEHSDSSPCSRSSPSPAPQPVPPLPLYFFSSSPASSCSTTDATTIKTCCPSPEPPAITCLCLCRSKCVCSCCVSLYAHVCPDVCVCVLMCVCVCVRCVCTCVCV